MCLPLSPSQRLPLGIPIKISIIEKNRKRALFFFSPASPQHKEASAEERVSAGCLIVCRRLLRPLYIASGALLPLDCHSRPESAAFFKTFGNPQQYPLRPLRPESSNAPHPLQGQACQPAGTENLDIFKKAGQNLEIHLVRKKIPLVFLQLTIFQSLRCPPSCHHGHQQLVMVNYVCAFSQSESGKYFELIIKIIIRNNVKIIKS